MAVLMPIVLWPLRQKCPKIARFDKSEPHWELSIALFYDVFLLPARNIDETPQGNQYF